MVSQGSVDPAAAVELITAALEPEIHELYRQHPIQAGILRAFFEQVLDVIRLSALDLPPEEFLARTIPLLDNARELGVWLVGPMNEPSLSKIHADIDSWVGMYVSCGHKRVADFTETLRKTLLDKPRGRPAKRKRAALEALEAKLADPKLTWEALAKRLYPPGKDENIDSPAQALRQEVIVLRKVLKKYGIAGSAPFERQSRIKEPSQTPTT